MIFVQKVRIPITEIRIAIWKRTPFKTFDWVHIGGKLMELVGFDINHIRNMSKHVLSHVSDIIKIGDQEPL